MPVAHGYVCLELDIRRFAEAAVQVLVQCGRLFAREAIDRRATAYHLVIYGHFFGARPGDVPAYPVAQDPLQRDVDDSRIHEQIVEEDLDLFVRVEPAEVEDIYAYPKIGRAT